MALSGYRRALVVMLAAASVVGLAGTATTGLAGRADRTSVGPAAAYKSIPIKIIGRKRLVQQATTGGTTTDLLTLEKVSFRSVCTDLGGNTFRVEIQAKSDFAAFLVGSVGSGLGITPTYQTVWVTQNSVASGIDQAFDLLLRKGLTRRFDAVLSVHLPGADCGTQLTAYNG